MSSPEGPFAVNVWRCARWSVWIAAPIAVLSFAASLVFPGDTKLYAENGPLELISAILWGLIMLGGLGAALRAPNCTQRLLLAWFAGLALLAGLREFDLHTALNPDTLGEFGVRYKLSWWLDGSVPLWLKLGWGVLFVLVLGGVSYPPWRTRRELYSLVVRLDPRLLMFGSAFVFLALGFVVDDLLRGSKYVKFETRQMLEETSEFIGACLYGFAVSFLARYPLGQSSALEGKSPPASP